MSIHTIETSTSVMYDLFYPLKEYFFQYASAHRSRFIPNSNNLNSAEMDEFCRNARITRSNKPHKNEWTLPIQEKGITIILKEINGRNLKGGFYCNCHINYKINLARVIGRNYVDIFSSHESDIFLYKINRVLSDIHCLLPLIEHTKLVRVDFTCNVYLADGAIVDAYIKLAKRAFIPARFSKVPIIREDGTEFQPNNSVKYRQGNIALVVYDKYSQMANSTNKFVTHQKEYAYGILRVELQVERYKLVDLFASEGVKSLNELLVSSDFLAKMLFSRYLKKFFAFGDYYTFDEAVEMIKRSPYQNKVKIDMIMILESVSRHHSFDKGLRSFYKKPHKIKRMIERFNEIGVSPCTIPRRLNIKHLENITNLVINSINGR